MIEYIVECNEVIGITGKPIVVPSSIDLSTEVVRCRDCRFQDDIKYCDRLGFEVGDYGFCAWGDRKQS